MGQMRAAGRTDDSPAGSIETVSIAAGHYRVATATSLQVWPVSDVVIKTYKKQTKRRHGRLLPVEAVQGP